MRKSGNLQLKYFRFENTPSSAKKMLTEFEL